MENVYCFTRKNVGAVLISALLFLLVLTLLAMSILQTGLLETKMSTNYQDANFALQKAKLNLTKKEQAIAKSKQLPTGVELISNAICGVTFYRVTAAGEYQKTVTTLQSTFAIMGDASHCHARPTIHPGRQSWRGPIPNPSPKEGRE